MPTDRTLAWGDDQTEATYVTGDTDPAGGGNFVVAEDTDGSTTLLEWDNTNNQWVSRGPVEMSGNDITNVGALDATSLQSTTVRTETIGAGDYHYAGDYDGADPDARLSAALTNTGSGDVIYLENTTYVDNQTISDRKILQGTGVGNRGTLIDATWTLAADGVKLCHIGQVLGDVVIDGNDCSITQVLSGGGSDNVVTVNGNRALINDSRFMDITFDSTTSDGLVDSCVTSTVTDNGTNNVGDVV